MPSSREGLYETLVTRAVERWLADLVGLTSEIKEADPAESSLRLARHIAAEAERALRTLKGTTGAEQQVELCNKLLRQLAESVPGAGLADTEVAPPPRLLLGVYRKDLPTRPVSPLAVSTLLTRARSEPALGHELGAEIASADRIDALVSFVTVGGFRSLREELEGHAQRGRPFRLLTTTYTGATDADAVESIARLPGAAVRVSYDERRTRLHAKAWLFSRESGLSTAYIGSANLSQAALFGGHEWMMKVAEVDLPHVIEKFRGAFDSLWEDAEFEPFCPDDEAARQRLRQALRQAHGTPDPRVGFYFTLVPLPFQSEILDQLEAERALHGRRRNLVVAATGTGKTMVAAFDYQRQIGDDRLRPRLLFLAHREEILRQALDTFRHVLRDEAFGELLTGRDRPATLDHLFATIQSARSQNLLEHLPVDYWKYVVVDECHHIPAPTYQDIVPKLRPRILVGLTATPERTDGKSLLPDFDNHIAADIRLWHAIDRQLLVPFEYYGLNDGVDLRQARWSRGSYVDEDLTKLYTGNDRRAELVIEQLRRFGGDPQRLRALGFCVSVAHAEFMARKFREAGIAAEAVHGETSHDARAAAPRCLEQRSVNVLFTCDLYNEGIDLPWVDTLLLLRPTASAMLFLQQLGRGLRTNRGKASCLVLDFIGQHRQEFRFDQILSALTGVPRGRLRAEVEAKFPTLPSGCTFHLDPVARGFVLDSLKRAVAGGPQRLARELGQLASDTPTTPWSLAHYLEASGRELEEVYAAGGWTSLRRQAGLLDAQTPAGESRLNARFRLLLHIDDPDRLEFYQRALRGLQAIDRPTEVERRRLLMLGYQLLDEHNRFLEPAQVVPSISVSV
jgi:superfamily II DNA or RNA helicase